MHKTLHAIAAAFLSILSQGVGHLYVASLKRAYILIALTFLNYTLLLFALPLSYSLWPLKFKYFYWTMMLYLLLYTLFVVYDSVRLSFKKLEVPATKAFPKHKALRFVAFLTLAIIISTGTALLLPSKSVYNYVVPSAAMSPTLQLGDHIIAVENSGAYLSEIRNAVVTYNYPPEADESPDNYKIHVGRVAAIEGDKIRINLESGNLFVNGTEYPLVNRGSANFEELKAMYEGTSKEVFVKDLWAGKELEIPLGQVFILRDNYSDGIDSRSKGPIDAERIGEKVVFIYFSKKDNKTQWDRINKNIE